MSWKNSCRDGFSRWHILRSYVQLHVILCCIDVQVHARHQPAFRAYDHSTSILFFAFPCNPEMCAWIGTRRWSRICWSQEWPNSDTSQSESTQDYPSSLITELSKLSIMKNPVVYQQKPDFSYRNHQKWHGSSAQENPGFAPLKTQVLGAHHGYRDLTHLAVAICWHTHIYIYINIHMYLHVYHMYTHVYILYPIHSYTHVRIMAMIMIVMAAMIITIIWSQQWW